VTSMLFLLMTSASMVDQFPLSSRTLTDNMVNGLVGRRYDEIETQIDTDKKRSKKNIGVSSFILFSFLL
jgi:hypothetical protein